MQRQSSKDLRRDIFAIAARQGGYFTVGQAASVGYDRRRLAYHAGAENFERVERGLYRVPSMPVSEHDDLIRASFWSRDRSGEPQGTVSHRTALAVHGLGDLFAGAIHLTVPPGFRNRPPGGWVLHRGVVGLEDREDHGGFWITTAQRTLLDVSGSDDVGKDELAKAVADALEKGVVIRGRLVRAAEEASAERLIDLLLRGGR
jgi:predicted transcriptional regulator of viral defense system